ncbi:AAA family ATPase [Stenotrophomonas sp. RS-48]|uniref:AAA family ATPase n=1 Tax=Stenotrophomonas sp. RS-48 TaxID=3043300 RepID=UPI0024B4AAD5|nr:AAA family ATPase [Stenotrophomonas sp. RS-48]MDI9247119.1 AAA family ATPase [Stenotrophomonas sp. RS-48]
MIEQLALRNVGPAPSMDLEFGRRLNLLTGDNGLGKSFLLDIAWWSLTRKWPAELNRRLPMGLPAKPHGDEPASITFSVTGQSKSVTYQSKFDRKDQAWKGAAGRPVNPGLVLYAQADGSFAAWDPARNYWRKKGNVDVQDRPPAYVFSTQEIWDGLRDSEGRVLCNGLISDWASWQKERGEAFKRLEAVLSSLSPSAMERIQLGNLTRISLDDARDIPTIRMPYGQDVPVLHASAGLRRILALAYLLVWTWEEHLKAAALIDMKPTHQVTFLVDEIECHLHPKWQRRIVAALLEVVKSLAAKASVQVIAATHSPLVMASVEPIFDAKEDAWFDLDFETIGKRQSVVVRQRQFVVHGEAGNWLTSEAFDLRSSRSIEAEEALERAALAMARKDFSKSDAQAIHLELQKVIGDTDPFWLRWRFVGEKKGWLP